MDREQLLVRALLVGLCLLLISALAFGILRNINNVKCAKISIPTFTAVMDHYLNYAFANADDRYVAELVGRSKLRDIGLDLDVTSLRDNALFAAITSDILSTNPKFIAVLNHPRYVDVIRNYNAASRRFHGLRADALTIVRAYTSAPDTITDEALYSLLIYG